jgi:hypothetical protein
LNENLKQTARNELRFEYRCISKGIFLVLTYLDIELYVLKLLTDELNHNNVPFSFGRLKKMVLKRILGSLNVFELFYFGKLNLPRLEWDEAKHMFSHVPPEQLTALQNSIDSFNKVSKN